MSQYVINTFDYVDNGVVQRKQTWQDSTTGATWDTFDPVGPADDPNLPNGTVVNQSNPYNTQNAGASADQIAASVPFAGRENNPNANPNANRPTGLQGNTYNNGQQTSGTNTPQSGTYAAPAQSGQSGGSNMPPPMRDGWNQQGGAQQAAASGNPLNPADLEAARNRFLYNPDQAGQAFDNVLRDRGFRLGLNNPLTNMLRQYAPGLSAAYNINNVVSNRGNEPSADIGAEFRDFLGGALSGTGGGLFNTLNSARGNIGNALGQINQSEASRAAGGGVGEVNPWIANLQQMLEGNGGGNLAGVLRGLSAPFMTGSMSNAYGNALNQNLASGIYQYGQPGGGFEDPNTYWLQQLFNGRQ